MTYTNWHLFDGVLKIPTARGNGQQVKAMLEELLKIDGVKEIFEKYEAEFNAK